MKTGIHGTIFTSVCLNRFVLTVQLDTLLEFLRVRKPAGVVGSVIFESLQQRGNQCFRSLQLCTTLLGEVYENRFVPVCLIHLFSPTRMNSGNSASRHVINLPGCLVSSNKELEISRPIKCSTFDNRNNIKSVFRRIQLRGQSRKVSYLKIEGKHFINICSRQIEITHFHEERAIPLSFKQTGVLGDFEFVTIRFQSGKKIPLIHRLHFDLLV